MKRGRKPIDFTGVDLTRSTHELVMELRCCEATIRKTRKLFGVKGRRGKIIQDFNLLPQAVDFSRPALHIAKDNGLSYYNVLCYMRANNIPVRKRGVPKGTIFASNRFHNVTFDWGLRDAPLAEMHGCTREYIRQLRKKAGEPASGSREWEDKYHPVKTSQQPDT